METHEVRGSLGAVRTHCTPGLVQRLKQLWDSVRMTVFIVGSAIIVFACARNTITWWTQRLWGASGSFWQSRWEYVHDLFNGDDFSLVMLGTFVVTHSVFWLANIPLLLSDVYGWPQVLRKYKIQEDKNVPVGRSQVLRAVTVAFLNQTVFGVPYLWCVFHIMKWRGLDFGPELPSFHWVVVEITVFSLVEEVFFYYSHRLFHTPRLYKRFHKMHHEWTAPIGITSIYAHPVEHLVCNNLPAVLGPLLMGSHIATVWLWLSLVLLSTTVAHSGYHLPLLPSPEAHDFHHSKFNNNFGVLGILDRLHGTDTSFRSSKAYERHFLLLSLVPVSQQIPDSPCHKAN